MKFLVFIRGLSTTEIVDLKYIALSKMLFFNFASITLQNLLTMGLSGQQTWILKYKKTIVQ